eukprot:5548628-Pyramimonas_sp.AAC.1
MERETERERGRESDRRKRGNSVERVRERGRPEAGEKNASGKVGRVGKGGVGVMSHRWNEYDRWGGT